MKAEYAAYSSASTEEGSCDWDAVPSQRKQFGNSRRAVSSIARQSMRDVTSSLLEVHTQNAGTGVPCDAYA